MLTLEEIEKIEEEVADNSYGFGSNEIESLCQTVRELYEEKIPIVSHHCRTTHSACACVLKNMNKLEKENKKLKKIYEAANSHSFDKRCTDCDDFSDIIKAIKQYEEG